MFRLWIVVIALTAITWLALKILRKPNSLFLVFLFWVIAIWGSVGLFYGLSVFFATQ